MELKMIVTCPKCGCATLNDFIGHEGFLYCDDCNEKIQFEYSCITTGCITVTKRNLVESRTY